MHSQQAEPRAWLQVASVGILKQLQLKLPKRIFEVQLVPHNQAPGAGERVYDSPQNYPPNSLEVTLFPQGGTAENPHWQSVRDRVNKKEISDA